MSESIYKSIMLITTNGKVREIHKLDNNPHSPYDIGTAVPALYDQEGELKG
jgi:hypothetical protein